jgi:hypothetical protein
MLGHTGLFLSATKDPNDNITFQASLDSLNAACKPSFNIYSLYLVEF